MPNPSIPAPATGLPIPHPRLVEMIEREKLRTKIEEAVARLIDALDAIDAPAEDMEPSLGFYPGHVAPDAEADSFSGVADDEPSLGSRDTLDQTDGWSDRCPPWDHDLEWEATHA